MTRESSTAYNKKKPGNVHHLYIILPGWAGSCRCGAN